MANPRDHTLPITGTFPDPINFDFDGFYEYTVNKATPASTVWTSTHMDHRRLPGNSSIFELLLYNGYLFNKWSKTENPIGNDTGNSDHDNKSFEEQYLRTAGYLPEDPTETPAYNNAGENILYSPQYPDNIYSLEVDTINSGDLYFDSGVGGYTADVTSPDSPQDVIPPIISYEITRREPASMEGGRPFGKGKDYKFRSCGVFKGSDGNVYELRSRFWENLVCFTCIAVSGYAVESLCWLFEKFMDLKEGELLAAGVAKMIPWGRFKEPDVKLENSNLHYRKTYFYFRTQEFQISGPITSISSIDMETVTGGD